MENHNHIELTASEISTLWAAYRSDTMTVCGLKVFLSHVEDNEVQRSLEETLSITEDSIRNVTGFLKQEEYPIPHGFGDQDINLNAPRLFSDKLCLEYILHLTNLSLVFITAALVTAERKDVIDLYAEKLNTIKELHKQVKELVKEKGIYIRSPHIPKHKQADFVQKQSFLTGWFGHRRPLLGAEISSLVFNAKRNALGQALITGFSQVAKAKQVRRYFERGREISGKHLEIFTSILHENHLSNGALLMTPEVTDSTESPFSDKLMMQLITGLIASGIGEYGVSMSTSPRRDLGVHYTRLAAEIANYADDGAEIMIDNGWLEQPPKATDRKELSK